MTQKTADRRRARADTAARIAAGLVFVALAAVIGIAALAVDEEEPSTTTTVVELVPEQPEPSIATEEATSTATPTPQGGTGGVSSTTKQTTTTEPVAGSTETTTVTTESGTDASFWGRIWSSPGFLIGAQLLVAVLAAFVVGGLVQRAWLGVFDIALSASGVELPAIPKADIEKAQRDIVRATEVPAGVASTTSAGPPVESPRLVLLQKRIELELRVRGLAETKGLPAHGDLASVVVGLQQREIVSPGLAAALLALFGIGDRIGLGADIEPAALIQLLVVSDDALAKLDGAAVSRLAK